MHGLGNDFVVIDGRSDGFFSSGPSASEQSAFAKTICDRRTGIGADGVLVLLQGSKQLQMLILNSDGSEAAMCGNGVRCFALFMDDLGLVVNKSATIEVAGANIDFQILGPEIVKVGMGMAALNRGQIGMTGDPPSRFIEQRVDKYVGTAISMGNPHLVIFVDSLEDVDLAVEGPRLEVNSLFPDRVNVHFVQVIRPDRLRMRTWERGAGATLACGTGASASVHAGVCTGRAEPKATVELPGGELVIEISKDGNTWMTGPAKRVFSGEWSA